MESFNRLTPAEAERLAVLLEELNEAGQAIGKVLRHGYLSTGPNTELTNRESLEREIGHVSNAVRLMLEAGDVREPMIQASCDERAVMIRDYLHHQ